VVALHRAASRLDDLRPLGPELAVGDLADPAAVLRAMPEAPDAVFHLAGNTSVWRGNDAAQTRDNVEGTRNVVAAARARRARRLVHTSSVVSYGLGAGRATEETPSTAGTCWINYYRTKWLAEREVEAGERQGLEAVVLRPANIVGPHDRTNWSRLIRMVVSGRLPAVPPGVASWCHVREVARAHLAAAERGRPGGRYNLACLEASYLDFVRTVVELSGRGRVPRVLPPWVLGLYARAVAAGAALRGREPEVTPEAAAISCDRTTLDSSRAQRELGYRPSTLREMIGDCLAWMRREGLLPAPAAERGS
jgi:nucleoside-diphosphate-sugar epimerase